MSPELPQPTLIAAVATGIGLAAAVGLRVFVPLLVAGLGARVGLLPLATGFDWLGSDPALVMFAAAAACEIVAYFVPFLDNLLDTVAGPAAVVAGTVLAAATLVDMAPWLRWAMALIAGGGAAGLVHGTAAGLRAGGSVATAGLANPLLALVEWGGSALLAGLAILVPLLALVLAVALVVAVARVFRRRRRRRLLGLAPLLLAAALAAEPAQAAEPPGTPLVEFRIKDQFDTLHTSGAYRGAVVVVVAGDREGSRYIEQWAPALRDSVADLIARHRVKFLPVAHLKGVPFFVKRTIKGKFPQERDKWTLMDYEGLFKLTYVMPDDHCSLLVFDRAGRLRMQHAVTDFEPALQDELIAAIRRLGVAPR